MRLVDEGPQPLDGRTLAVCVQCEEQVEPRTVSGYVGGQWEGVRAWCRKTAQSDDTAAEVCVAAGTYWHKVALVLPDLKNLQAVETWLEKE